MVRWQQQLCRIHWAWQYMLLQVSHLHWGPILVWRPCCLFKAKTIGKFWIVCRFKKMTELRFIDSYWIIKQLVIPNSNRENPRNFPLRFLFHNSRLIRRNNIYKTTLPTLALRHSTCQSVNSKSNIFQRFQRLCEDFIRS